MVSLSPGRRDWEDRLPGFPFWEERRRVGPSWIVLDRLANNAQLQTALELPTMVYSSS